MTSRMLPAIAVVALALTAPRVSAGAQLESPQELIKDVVFNELADHDHHGFFQYIDEKRSGDQTMVKAEIETRTGRLHRMLAEDGKPLTAEQQQEESNRLRELLQDSGQQQKLLHDYQGDEDRIARIMRLLPEGFLYESDGMEGNDIRLKYRPNPAFKPPSYEEKLFHAMSGTIWIDARAKRLSRLQGQLVSNVDFGYGLLGRLDKGGTFDMQRVEVTSGNWKTRVLDVHIVGHVILLKSIGKEQDEVRTEFRQVPSDISLQQAEAVLDEVSARKGAREAGVASLRPIESAQAEQKQPVSLALK
jgi:hypothetical protein